LCISFFSANGFQKYNSKSEFHFIREKLIKHVIPILDYFWVVDDVSAINLTLQIMRIHDVDVAHDVCVLLCHGPPLIASSVQRLERVLLDHVPSHLWQVVQTGVVLQDQLQLEVVPKTHFKVCQSTARLLDALLAIGLVLFGPLTLVELYYTMLGSDSQRLSVAYDEDLVFPKVCYDFADIMNEANHLYPAVVRELLTHRLPRLIRMDGVVGVYVRVRLVHDGEQQVQSLLHCQLREIELELLF